MAECRTCHAPIVWGRTKNGYNVPMDPPEKRYVNVSDGTTATPQVEMQDTWLSHFATCPQADEHRKKREEPIPGSTEDYVSQQEQEDG